MSVTLPIDDDLHERLARVAAAANMPTVAALRDAIASYVERADHRAAFHEEALASLADFERTGLHLTGDETAAWLVDWTPDRPAPTCHD